VVLVVREEARKKQEAEVPCVEGRLIYPAAIEDLVSDEEKYTK